MSANMPPSQQSQDDSDYQISPPISFTGLTQNNEKHPSELKPGNEVVKCTMFVGEHDTAPTWPWPAGELTWDYTLHPLSPVMFAGGGEGGQQWLGVGKGSSGTSGLTLMCADWFQMGPYIVALRPSSYIAGTYSGQLVDVDTFSWNSPAIVDGTAFPAPADEDTIAYLKSFSPTYAYDVYYQIMTTVAIGGTIDHPTLPTVTYTTRYYTGAGWMVASGAGTFWWAVEMGLSVITFDSTGIGRMDWTGDENIPFSFRKSLWGQVTAGWPCPIGGSVYFVDTGGKLFETDGSTMQEVGHTNMQTYNHEGGPFNALLIPELFSSWPLTDIRTTFDDVNHRLIVYMGPGYTMVDGLQQTVDCGIAAIDFKTARFQFTPASAVLNRHGNIGTLWTVDATSTGTPTITTGGIELVKPEFRTHVHYADVVVESESDPSGMTITGEIKDVYDEDSTFVSTDPITVTATGKSVVRLTFNKLIERVPAFRFTLQNPPGTKVRLHAIERIAFQEGGVRI